MGPSQSSVRMLSSERRLWLWVGTLIGSGSTGSWWTKSAWNMGMMVVSSGWNSNHAGVGRISS